MSFGDTFNTHSQMRRLYAARACAPLYAWGQGLHAAIRVGTGAEERLVAGILGAGRVAGWGGRQGRLAGWGGWGGCPGGCGVWQAGWGRGDWPGGGRCYCHSHAHSSNY